MKHVIAATVSVLCAGGLAACVSAAQEPPSENTTTDEFFGFVSWQELDLKPRTSVSLYDLIANGNKYDNQYIQVYGFLRYEVEDGTVTASRLYPNTDSLKYDVYVDSIRVFRETLPDCYSVRLAELNGEFLLLSGIYRNSWKMLTPVSHIRLIELNDEARTRRKSEILCNDPSLDHLVKPDEAR